MQLDAAYRKKYRYIMRDSIDASRVGRMRAEGLTIREIAEDLGVSRSLVHKTLANRSSMHAAITRG
jgi:DNA-binding CsgD family transcriptional regulator